MVEPLAKIQGYYDLGERLLIDTLSSAYYALTKNPIYKNAKRYKEGSDSLSYVLGGGLDKTIDLFGLDLDPGRLKELFFFYVEIA